MLEGSLLYRRWATMLANLTGDPGLANAFAHLRTTVSEQSKIIIRVFPEYTPHDATRHLEHLFLLADRVLGVDLYDKLNAAELSVIVFALYAHDWGMAVSDEERAAISGARASEGAVLIPDEPRTFRNFHDEAIKLGKSEAQAWEDYLRATHAQRSGSRLRKELTPLSPPFAEMVARAAEGHVLDLREIRDPERYPLHTALLGHVANVAAAATYVRLVDLLDLAEDRTPFALWSIVRPQNMISQTEWKKHRALAPIAVSDHTSTRQVLIAGATDDPDVYAALADLRNWVDRQFAESVGFLRHIGNQYDLRLDSTIKWDIKAVGFEPVLLRFDFDRAAALDLLSTTVYGGQQLTFVRELLQNSVDAIDTRAELLRQSHSALDGRISITIASSPDMIRLEWSDNGIGMDRHILETYFAKIGRSWYHSSDFRRHSLANDPISKFGVGLLSCFALSPSLTVLTKREPLLARDSHGWRVHIPTRDGHFVVKADDQVPVGTTVMMGIRPNRTVTAEVIATTIRKTGLLVKYKIVLSVDGLVDVIEPVSSDGDPRLPFVQVASLDEEALASLQSLTTELKVNYRAASGAYEAFFSCLLPRDLSSITSLRSSKWYLGRTEIDFHSFIINQPQRLFIKGIASGGDPRAYPGDAPQAFVSNILKPSLVRPDLSRAHIDMSSVNLDEAWNDVAARIRERIAPHTLSIDERVRALSVAGKIAEIPEKALAHLVPPDQWPAWMLEAGSGLSWRENTSISGIDEILEGPDELRFALEEGRTESALESAQSWAGPACFVALPPYAGPWFAPATRLVRVLLENWGFAPTALRLVNGTDDDDVPLACPAWRKQPSQATLGETLDLAEVAQRWRKEPTLAWPTLMEQILRTRQGSDSVPLLVQFPDSIGDVAAIGSIYWNQNNPKIRALVEALLELSVRSRRGAVSGRTQRVFEYVNSTSFLGYVAPARHSSGRAAIDRYRELMTVAREEGLPFAEPLGAEDFFPGSVGRYWNPYHYPISSWAKSKRRAGTPWNEEQQGKRKRNAS